MENQFNQIIYYVQEYAKENDLAGLLLDTPLSQIIFVEIFLQVADTMSFIASKSIVHSDLGCRNDLVFRLDPLVVKNNLVKITDFGLARSLNRSSIFENSCIFPKRYCALEILRNDGQSSYTEKSDVYSMVVRAKLDNGRLNKPPICNRQLWTLMTSCWEDEREWLPNFEEIQERLSVIEPSEVSDVRQPISSYEPPTGYTFKLNVDVSRNGLLGGKFRKIYEAQWMLEKGTEPIVLIEMNEAPTDYEVLFYKERDNHQHMISTFGFVTNNFRSIILLQERAHHGHLQELLQNNVFEPTSMVLVDIFLQIIDAMIYIVDKGMIHGNLCCSNVLVFQMDSSKPKGNFIKLTNFALARPNISSKLEDKRLTIPVEYCAPEIFRSAGRLNYSELSDVYLMGILMWEACSQGKLPYGSSISNKEIRQKKLNGEILPRPWMCDRQIWPIIKKCWENEPESRYKFQVLQTKLSSINLE
ncbi:unnamed protein product [Rotaria sp. Silwood2]|nr:unnamed protein product [Rotaria sp. Silwood2]